MSYLDKLRANNQALRLAGVGGLLHNLGKVCQKFIGSQVQQKTDEGFLYQHIVQIIAPHCAAIEDVWDKLDKLPGADVLEADTKSALSAASISLNTPFDDRCYAPGDMIEYAGIGKGEPWYNTDSSNSGKFEIEKIYTNGSRLTHLMNRSHRGASGGEKEGIAVLQLERADQLWRSTPFGWETPAANASNIEDLRKKIESEIQRYLTTPGSPFPLKEFSGVLKPLLRQAIADTQRPLNDMSVWDIGHSGMAFLVSQALGRVLNNETLEHAELNKKENGNSLFWKVLSLRMDGIAYLKDAASIADLRVRRQRLMETLKALQCKIEDKLFFGVEVYRDENGSFFVIPDLDMHSDGFREIAAQYQKLVEVDGVRFEEKVSPRLVNHPKDKGGAYIGEHIQEEIKMLPERHFSLDTFQESWEDGNGNRSNKEVCTACGVRPKGYGAEKIDRYKNNQLYYSGKAESRHICCVCMERRSGVAENWAKSGLNRDTIWTYEVADSNGRLALLSGQFDLHGFLSGMAYPSEENLVEKQVYRYRVRFLLQQPGDGDIFSCNGENYKWTKDEQILEGSKRINYFLPKSIPVIDINKQKLDPEPSLVDVKTSSQNQLELILENNLPDAVGDSVQCWGETFEVKAPNALIARDFASVQKVKRVVFSGMDYPFIVTEDIGKISFLLEKQSSNPKLGASSQSFARFRRVWETTREFWRNILPADPGAHFADCLVQKIISEKGPRLGIKGDFHGQSVQSLGDYHVYDLVLERGVKLDVVWDPDPDPENNRFITADNLDTLAGNRQLDKSVSVWLTENNGKTVPLEEPDEKAGGNRKVGDFTILGFSEIPESQYLPVIPILSEPRTFMALVPAENAEIILRAIKTKYEREMGKVRNRLPLHLGAVFFNRRTPLRAAMDAGYAMLGDARKNVGLEWEVLEDAEMIDGFDPPGMADGFGPTDQFQKTISVRLRQDGLEGKDIRWNIPARMGDGTTEDEWYPYVRFISDSFGNHIPNENRQSFIHPDSRSLHIHARDLKQGDQIEFTASTFDFEFLDTTGRRFDIHYDPDGRRPSRSSRPFLLEDLDRLSILWAGLKRMDVAQRYKVIHAIETTREMWFGHDKDRESWTDGTFRQFVADTLTGAVWPEGTAPWRNDADSEGDRKQILDDWIAAGVRGELADLAELKMGIQKV